MIAVGVIAVLVVLYILLGPKEAPREYDEYCAMEYVTNRSHNNRTCYLQNK